MVQPLHAEASSMSLRKPQCLVQDPRLLVYSLRIRYDDASKVDKITDDIRAFFESHPGVDHKLPYKAALSDLATYSVDISITVRPRCHS